MALFTLCHNVGVFADSSKLYNFNSERTKRLLYNKKTRTFVRLIKSNFCCEFSKKSVNQKK